jgi:hypothetical protein
MRELRERAEPILKIVCLILAVLVVYQLAGMARRWNPFRGVIVPAVPSLVAGTNTPSGSPRGTNLAMAAAGKATNSTRLPTGTNAAPSVTSTNTNSTGQAAAVVKATNSTIQADLVKTNFPGETNVVAHLETKLSGTNSAPATNSADKGTNVLKATTAAGTNAAPGPKAEKKISSAAAMPDMTGMNFNPFAPPGKRGADLPPAVQTRISRITDSEILGPVMRPLPMGLLGIAGEFAFLRSANGQTGLVKEGDSLDDLKLLRIGINRVLIEQAGQKKELMIFSGYGGESLLPTNTPDENNHP